MASKALISIVLLAVLGAPSWAQQAQSDKTPNSVGEHFSGKTLDDIIRLEAELEMLNKRSAIMDIQRRLENSPAQTFPSVVSVIVNEGSAVARVVYTNGMSRFIEVGDTVGGNYVVTSITTDGVEVSSVGGKSKKAAQKLRLPFGAPGTAPQNIPAPSLMGPVGGPMGPMGIPGMLPPPR